MYLSSWRAKIGAAAVLALFAATAPPAATATPRLATTLERLQHKVLETPVALNPLADGDHCVDLGHIVAPLRPPTVPSLTCKVKPGTSVFVTVWGSNCSNVEPPPYFGRNERELRRCVRAVNSGIRQTEIALDGRPVPVREVETGLFRVDLPADNILGVPAQRALAVGHGWVARLDRLRPGAHRITVRAEGTYLGEPLEFALTTKIIVQGR